MSTANAAISINKDRTEPRTKAAVTASYFSAFIALGLTTGALGPTLPGLAAHTHSRLSIISYLFTARSLGYVVGSLRGGKLFDSRAGNPIMATMLVAMAAMMILVPLTPSFVTLFLVMLSLGAAEATIDVGGNTLLTWAHGNRVGSLLNGLHSCFGIGALAAPLLVALLVLFGRNTLDIYPVLAVILLPLAALLIRLPSPPTQSQATADRTGKNNRGMVILIAAFLFLYVGAEVSFGGWVFTYAGALRLGTATTAAYLTSAFWGSLTIGRLAAVWGAVRWSPKTILLGDLAGCLLSLGLIATLSHSFVALLGGTLGLGFFMASIFPTLISFAGENLKLTGQTTGRFIVGASMGAMSLPLLIGQIFEPLGPSVMVYVVLGALVSASAILILLLRKSGRHVGKNVLCDFEPVRGSELECYE